MRSRRGQDGGEIVPGVDPARAGHALLAFYLGLYVLVRKRHRREAAPASLAVRSDADEEVVQDRGRSGIGGQAFGMHVCCQGV